MQGVLALGKTTVSEKIKEEFGESVVILCHDFYYKSTNDVPDFEKANINYDHPRQIDTHMMVEDIKKLIEGKNIERPVYSFIEHNRENYTITVEPKKVIIIEGILIFENEELRNLMDIKIFVDTDTDIRVIRRIKRDVKKRGRDLDSVINQYCNTVKPMHEQFVEPSKKYADIIIPEGGHNVVAVDMIIEKIRGILNSK